MNIPQRNRAIKKALAREFGYNNVRVQGGKGTAYGWVEISIHADLPPKKRDENGWSIDPPERFAIKEGIEKKVIAIIKDAGLWSEIGNYYTDSNYWRKEVLIRIEDKYKKTVDKI